MNTPVLVADIGGTHIRLALSTHAGAPLQGVSIWRCADFEHPLAAFRCYLAQLASKGAPLPRVICLAVAAPVQDDHIRMTNNHWHFSRMALASALQLPVMVLNDFEAQAWCLLHPEQLTLRWINPAQPVAHWPRALRTVAGPGTGFGAASLTPGGEVISAEPGHIAFAPLNQQDLTVLQQLWRWFPRVTVEHMISGPGIANTYCALANQAGQPMTPDTSPNSAEIVSMAEHSALAADTLRCFSRWLGAVCGDLALAKGSTGGFFLSGALLAKLGRHFDQSAFLQAFTNKATFSHWCSAIPVAYVEDEWPGLTGCAMYTHHHPNLIHDAGPLHG